MGVFDSIYFDCPGCKDSIEVQSKAAENGPSMRTFSSNEVPKAIAVDIDEDTVICESCARQWKVKVKKLKPIYRCKLEPLNDNENGN